MLEAMKKKIEVHIVRLRKFYVFLIAFFVVLMVPLMYQNSNMRIFERVKNVPTNSFKFGGRVQNITQDNPNGRNLFKRFEGSSLKSSTNDSPQHTRIPHDKDKLFGGLLVDGFDHSSCISRLQSHLYRKASPHKPSPYLISKLRNYEKMHRMCGPNSRAYNRDMRKIAESKNNNGTTRTLCKYIFWSASDGLGNQILSMTSTFLYAVLTDRVFLVKFGKDKLDLFCEPFLNSTWLLPENTHFKHVPTLQSIVDENFTSPMPTIVFVDLRYHISHPERLFHCDDSQDHLSKVPLLILQSNQYFVPSLFMTPLFNEELNKMFPDIDTIFHHLGHYLFHPSNEAWKLINNFYQENWAKADEKIGLQIRVYHWSTTPQKVFMDQILNCTIQNKILPQVGISLQSSVSSSGNNVNQSVKSILVASLSPKYGGDLRAMYMNKTTVTGEVIKVYQPSSEEYQKIDDQEQNMNAWVEMYLLSLSDVLVTTYQSTFGYVAKGLGNSRAWLLYKPENDEKVPFPACEQEFLLEPCYHAPPHHQCDGQIISDFTLPFPYIRHCIDYSFGVKMINASSSINM